jgi:hypothetical protein
VNFGGNLLNPKKTLTAATKIPQISYTLVQLSSPLLSSHSEESKEAPKRDGNEVILSSTSMSSTKLGTMTSNGTVEMDDSAEKQLGTKFI